MPTLAGFGDDEARRFVSHYFRHIAETQKRDARWIEDRAKQLREGAHRILGFGPAPVHSGNLRRPRIDGLFPTLVDEGTLAIIRTVGMSGS